MCLVLARFRKIIISQDNNFTEINGSKRDMRIWSNIREIHIKMWMNDVTIITYDKESHALTVRMALSCISPEIA